MQDGVRTHGLCQITTHIFRYCTKNYCREKDDKKKKTGFLYFSRKACGLQGGKDCLIVDTLASRSSAWFGKTKNSVTG